MTAEATGAAAIWSLSVRRSTGRRTTIPSALSPENRTWNCSSPVSKDCRPSYKDAIANARSEIKYDFEVFASEATQRYDTALAINETTDQTVHAVIFGGTEVGASDELWPLSTRTAASTSESHIARLHST